MQQLHDDHSNFRRLLALMLSELDDSGGGIPDFDVLREAMRYMVNYSDRFHHPLEDLIFARLAEKDAGIKETLEDLESEHESLPELGRELFEMLSADPEQATMTWQAIDGMARDYIELMSEHKDLEEEKVFPMAKALITDAEFDSFREEIEWREDPLFGPALADGYRTIYQRLIGD